jgi:hypothetical protein
MNPQQEGNINRGEMGAGGGGTYGRLAEGHNPHGGNGNDFAMINR